ncbi:TPA: hypothetical protein ACH3X3_012557 [Trebouxia sp. C0006]
MTHLWPPMQWAALLFFHYHSADAAGLKAPGVEQFERDEAPCSLPPSNHISASSSKAAARLGCITQLVINGVRGWEMPPEAHTAPGGQPDGSSLQQAAHRVY